MKISLIIPNYNGEALLKKNLPFFLKAKNFEDNKIEEVIIVDDGSEDDSINILRKDFSWVKVIKHKINRGFSAAVNTGVRAAKEELICLLNSDVVPETDFLKSTFPFFESPKVFAVSLNEIGEFSWAKGNFIDGFVGHSPGPKSTASHGTFWVSGGSGVFRRSIWMELGGMDEKLLSPFYWEDVDLCYRALKRGYELVWDPNAKVTHEHEATISSLSKTYVQRILERNQLLFIWKNITSANLFRKHLVGLFKRLIKHPGYIRIVLMAFSRITPLLKARNKELKEARVSDEAIFSRF
jgi:O-antigen biosynthesis protein